MQSTSRRKFLAAVSAASAASAGLVSFASRAPGFLLESAALGADQPGERILVVVQLGGGNDGLNTVVPYTDETYHRRRPSLALGAGQVLKIDGSLGLHPNLKGLASLLESRQLAIVQGVGYPNPNRSHFESMDIWHAAHTQPKDRKFGWLGRAFDAHKSALELTADPPALHLGEESQPLALAARDVPSPSIRALAQFRLETGRDDRQRTAIQTAVGAPRSTDNELLKFVQTRSTSALEVSRRIEASAQAYKTSVSYPGTPLAEKLKRIAQLIDAG